MPVEFIIMENHCPIQLDTLYSLPAPTPTLYPSCHMTLLTMSNFVCVWNQRDDCPHPTTTTTTTDESESESFTSQELLELMELFKDYTKYNMNASLPIPCQQSAHVTRYVPGPVFML